MSTLFLNCFCDSIFEKMCERLGTCTPEVVEKGTNCADVAMTAVICKAVVCVALILVLGFLVWKLMDHIANGISGWRKRVWEVNDIKRKQKSDLLTRLLDFKKDLALNYEKKGKDDEKKKYDDIIAKEYIARIETFLDKNYSNEKKHDTQEPKTTNS